MFIYLLLFSFYLYYSNFNNYFLIYFLIYFLVYFLNLKNFFNIYEYNIFIEDRIVILLENIIKIDYNLLILCLFILLIINLYIKHFNLIIFFLFYTIFTKENFFYCQDYFNLFFFSFKLNVKLLNGLFLIHPYCIYFFYSVIILLFLNNILYNFFIFNYSHKNYHKNHLLKLNNFYSIGNFFGITAIILGSWWAYQEINWNSWWSWDLIEIVNLILITLFLSYIHSHRYKTNILHYILNQYLMFFVLLNFLIISRYNIINSLHSFVILNNFEQFSYVFLVFFVLFLSLLFLAKYFYINILVFSKFDKINTLHYLFYFIVVIFLYKVYYEIFLFIFNIDSSLEYLYFYKNIILVLFTYALLIFVNLIIKFVFFLPFLNYFEMILIASVFLLTFYFNWQYFKLHFFFFFFLIIICLNLTISNFSLKLWNYNFLTYIENYKVNSLFFKKNINYYNSFISNIYNHTISYYYIENSDNFINFNKKIIFFLSNFFFYFSYIFIFNYKFFFYYSIFLYQFFVLYILIANILVLAHHLKKKINKVYLI